MRRACCPEPGSIVACLPTYLPYLPQVTYLPNPDCRLGRNHDDDWDATQYSKCLILKKKLPSPLPEIR